MTTTVLDDKGDKKTITVSQDEGVRPSTTMEGLAKLKPAFKDGGSTTAGERGSGIGPIAAAACPTLRPGADQSPQPREGDGGGSGSPRLDLMPPHPTLPPLGNSSQVSDGAAAVLLARRSKAEELGLPILGVLRSYAVVGVPPDVMGIGPAYAIPAALQKAGEMAPFHPGLASFITCVWDWGVLGLTLRVLCSEGESG